MKASSLVAVVCWLAVVAPVSRAAHGGHHARQGKHRAGEEQDDQSKQNAEVVAKIIAKVGSRRPSDVQQGFEMLGRAGVEAKEAVPAANARLRRGLSPALARVAMAALARVGQPSSTMAIAPYLRSREVSLRRAAATSLGHTGGPTAARWLVRALADRDEQVRQAAAVSLGTVGSSHDVPALLRALDHKVTSASASIGALCDKQGCEQFFRQLAKQPFSVMAPGLSRVLLRTDSADIDPLRVRVIARVQSLKTRSAHRFLVDAQQRWPEHGSATVKARLDAAVDGSSTAHGVSD